ncbi:MAG: endonuclease [Thermoguttaceae bacterium]|jgi:endonuclease I
MRYCFALFKKLFITTCLIVFCGLEPRISSADDANYEPPTNYYSSATGLTGSALQSQLRTIMSTGFVGRNYGDLRYADAVLDADPNQPGNILLIYSRASVSATWDSGVTWSREHQWPVSLLGTSDPSNSQIDMRSDEFLIRPINPSVNSSRSNSPYGLWTNSGSDGNKSAGYYYPGDADSGDCARALFYAVTRYPTFNGNSLSLVSGQPATYQMGDLNSLLHWNYTDTPDAFELRRNQAVYSSTLNPTYYQGNRNAFIDHPEYVWSVFVDQANDTSITTSTHSVDLGRVIVGASLGTQSVTINKSGLDGTYYSVTSNGNATSTVSGRYNAFDMDTTGSKGTTIGLNASTSTAGLKSGTVTVDNLDITTQGGAGKGGNDPDDVVTVTGSVLDHAAPSFNAGTLTSALMLDFGSLQQNSGQHSINFAIFNKLQTLGYTAALDLDSITPSGNTGMLTTSLTPFANLIAGGEADFAAIINTAAPGDFNASYTLNLSDENLPGAATLAPLTLQLHGTVTAVPEPAVVIVLLSAALGLLGKNKFRKL